MIDIKTNAPMPPCKPPRGPKIVQFQAMPNDKCWRGKVLCLGDNGILYITNHNGVLKPYLEIRNR